VSEKEAIAAIKRGSIQAGDIMVLIGCGPLGTGMEETYQLTSALKHLPFGKQVALVTDARFSGVSTGACIGHVGPEALAGGLIAKLRDGDPLRIEVNRVTLESSVNYVGADDLGQRLAHPKLAPNPALPDDTRLWAALQQAGGGTWGGCVYDANAIIAALSAGQSRVKSK
jgi:xylonate dehydratase